MKLKVLVQRKFIIKHRYFKKPRLRWIQNFQVASHPSNKKYSIKSVYPFLYKRGMNRVQTAPKQVLSHFYFPQTLYHGFKQTLIFLHRYRIKKRRFIGNYTLVFPMQVNRSTAPSVTVRQTDKNWDEVCFCFSGELNANTCKQVTLPSDLQKLIILFLKM